MKLKDSLKMEINKNKLSKETKRNIAGAEEDIRRGRVHKLEDVIKELKIKII